VVDLSDVTFIDENGETLLAEMRGAGVEFVATGVETKYVLENLKRRGERELRRSVRPACCGAATELPPPSRFGGSSFDLTAEEDAPGNTIKEERK
jgi:hypothetical protein